jgi:hypothetical protein
VSTFVDRLNEARAAKGLAPLPASEPARKPASSLRLLVLSLAYTWAAGLLYWLAYNYLCPRWHATPLSLTEGIMAWFIILTLRRLFSK